MLKSVELKNQLNQLKAEADLLMNKEGVKAEEINSKAEEIKSVKAKLDYQLQKEADEKADIENQIKNGSAAPLQQELDNKDINNEYKKAFYNALRGKSLTEAQDKALVEVNNALSSTTNADGGYLIPVDQQTAIKELKRELSSLEPLVNIEPVTTLTGSRNIEKDAEHTSFVEFEEGDDVPTADSPQFNNVAYSIKDRGGILPVPNNLLSDNTANLEAYLNRWLAKKQVATRNKLIVDLLATKTKVAITGIDDVKTILNVTLDPSISAMAIAVMNQDSFNKFDKMKDSDGKYLLETNPQNPTMKLLSGKPIYVISNKTLKTITVTEGEETIKKAPVIIGSLKEAITLFDRQAMSLMATNVGGDAFKKNRTDIRAITREDVKLVDTSAVVYAEIEV
ncbi:phage major capsid protein [Clostridium intestinale]|uniref:Phage major capsid protein n=1 Tax=Clostridium intestinale TaxID=36845 RepID=A0A7D6VVM4_9CLOT|nr:phage major capsid protein [Clostridium intestinale]QLY82237.1 phage major capsid protein [Clostridium intestinale]